MHLNYWVRLAIPIPVGSIAQLVERRSRNQKLRGQIRLGRANFSQCQINMNLVFHVFENSSQIELLNQVQVHWRKFLSTFPFWKMWLNHGDVKDSRLLTFKCNFILCKANSLVYIYIRKRRSPTNMTVSINPALTGIMRILSTDRMLVYYFVSDKLYIMELKLLMIKNHRRICTILRDIKQCHRYM